MKRPFKEHVIDICAITFIGLLVYIQIELLIPQIETANKFFFGG